MEKKFYDLLNDVESNLTEEERVEFTLLEAKVLKKNLRKQINGGRNMKKMKLAACCILVGAALVALPFGDGLYAGALSITYDIAGYLGIDQDLADYKTVLNQAQSDKGITVTLNEVILDQEDLIVATTEQYPENAQLATFFSGRVKVNGQTIGNGSSGSSEMVDDYTTRTVMSYHLGEVDLDQDLAIEIVYKEAMINGRTKKGNWRFAFQTHGYELAADTKTVNLDHTLTLPDGHMLTFDRLSSNAMGQKISFTLDNPAIGYIVELRGHDQLNNLVTFAFKDTDGKTGRLVLEPATNGPLSAEAKTLTLTPYASKMPEQSGRSDQDYEQIGEAFVIELE